MDPSKPPQEPLLIFKSTMPSVGEGENHSFGHSFLSNFYPFVSEKAASYLPKALQKQITASRFGSEKGLWIRVEKGLLEGGRDEKREEEKREAGEEEEMDDKKGKEEKKEEGEKVCEMERGRGGGRGRGRGRGRAQGRGRGVPLPNKGASLLEFGTVEHGYQYFKLVHLGYDKTTTKKVREAKTAKESKQLADRAIQLSPPDSLCFEKWNEKKREVMLELLRKKFEGEVLSRYLLSTQGYRLGELGGGYWGVEGENMLGLLLMEVRDELFLRNKKKADK